HCDHAAPTLPLARIAGLIHRESRGSLMAHTVPPPVESATMQHVLELSPGAGGEDLSGAQTEGRKGDGRLQRDDGMPVKFRNVECVAWFDPRIHAAGLFKVRRVLRPVMDLGDVDLAKHRSQVVFPRNVKTGSLVRREEEYFLRPSDLAEPIIVDVLMQARDRV